MTRKFVAICCFLIGYLGTNWRVEAQTTQVPAPTGAGQSNIQSTDTSNGAENTSSGGPTAEAQPNNTSAVAGQRFSFVGSIEIAEIYNSNIFSTASSPNNIFSTGATSPKSALVTESRLNLNLHDRTRRFQGDLAYSLVGDFYPQYNSLNTFQNYLNALANAELMPETIFLNARAFAWPAFLNRLGALYASPGNASSLNNRNVYGYTLTPDLRTRFRDIARSDLSLSRDEVLFDEPAGAAIGPAPPLGSPLNTVTNSVTERLSSLTFFDRFQWVLLASASDTSQDRFHASQRIGTADLNYRLSRPFTVLSTIGYQKYKSSPALTQDISGLIAYAGFHYSPDPSFQLTFKAGRQYNQPSYIGNLQYQITATSAFLVSVDDVVSTPQQRFLGNLSNINATAQGGFYQANTQLPDESVFSNLPPSSTQVINPSPADGLSLDNAVSRYRTGTATLIHKMPLTTYSFSVYGTVRDYLTSIPSNIDPRQTVIGTRLEVSHSFRRDLSGGVSVDYSAAREFGGIDKIFLASTNLDYVVTPVWTVFVRGSYLNREGGTSLFFGSGALSDVLISLGIRRTF